MQKYLEGHILQLLDYISNSHNLKREIIVRIMNIVDKM